MRNSAAEEGSERAACLPKRSPGHGCGNGGKHSRRPNPSGLQGIPRMPHVTMDRAGQANPPGGSQGVNSGGRGASKSSRFPLTGWVMPSRQACSISRGALVCLDGRE